MSEEARRGSSHTLPLGQSPRGEEKHFFPSKDSAQETQGLFVYYEKSCKPQLRPGIAK